MCGWRSLPASEASFRNCERETVPNSGARKNSGSMGFHATSLPAQGALARETGPGRPSRRGVAAA